MPNLCWKTANSCWREGIYESFCLSYPSPLKSTNQKEKSTLQNVFLINQPIWGTDVLEETMQLDCTGPSDLNASHPACHLRLGFLVIGGVLFPNFDATWGERSPWTDWRFRWGPRPGAWPVVFPEDAKEPSRAILKDEGSLGTPPSPI